MDISELVVGVILAFARIASFLFFVPMLNSRFIPAITKITVSLAVAIPISGEIQDVAVRTLPEFILMIAVQIFIGLTLAYIIEAIFSASRMAGGLLDMDMGFSAAQMIDPSSGQSTTIISNLFFILFVIVFVTLGGINALIVGIVHSFKFTVPGYFIGNESFLDMIASVVLYMLTASVQIALPLIASMFVLNFMMLVVGKSAPQMNVFSNMFLIKIAVGILLLYAALPFVGDVFIQMNDVLMEKYMEAMEEIFRNG